MEGIPRESDEFLDTAAKRLVHARRRAGLERLGLYKVSKLSVVSIENIELGRVRLTNERTIRSLAAAVHCTCEWLVEGRGPGPGESVDGKTWEPIDLDAKAGKRVVETRKAMNLTQRGLSKLSGLTEREVSCVERGMKVRLEPEQARALAGALRRKVGWLVRGKGDGGVVGAGHVAVHEPTRELARGPARELARGSRSRTAAAPAPSLASRPSLSIVVAPDDGQDEWREPAGLGTGSPIDELASSRLFPEEIVRVREDLGVGRGVLAPLLGVEPSMVTLWELGKVLPDLLQTRILRSMQEAARVGGWALGARVLEVLGKGDPMDALKVLLDASEREERIALTREGMERARERGVRIGHPCRVFDVEAARRMKAEGRSFSEVARALDVPRSTIVRALSRTSSG
jgi:transcriptional regulator with XRE-family HTH domain